MQTTNHANAYKGACWRTWYTEHTHMYFACLLHDHHHHHHHHHHHQTNKIDFMRFSEAREVFLKCFSIFRKHGNWYRLHCTLLYCMYMMYSAIKEWPTEDTYGITNHAAILVPSVLSDVRCNFYEETIMHVLGILSRDDAEIFHRQDADADGFR